MDTDPWSCRSFAWLKFLWLSACKGAEVFCCFAWSRGNTFQFSLKDLEYRLIHYRQILWSCQIRLSDQDFGELRPALAAWTVRLWAMIITACLPGANVAYVCAPPFSIGCVMMMIWLIMSCTNLRDSSIRSGFVRRDPGRQPCVLRTDQPGARPNHCRC